MPDLAIAGIVQAVHDILAADAKTKTLNGLTVNWHRGRLTWHGITNYPAGLVSLGPGLDVGHHLIGGESVSSLVPVIVRLRCSSVEGADVAEKTLNDLVSAVLDVLFKTANLKLGLDRVKFFRVGGQSVDSNPEASPATADADLIVGCRVIVS